MKIAVSGGFDPVHVGHIRMFKEASEMGDLYVILNSDDFLLGKKGKIFMTFEERKEILESIRYVHTVVPCIDRDMTVCATLNALLPDVFANGGDRVDDNTPEKEVCMLNNIKLVYGVGGGKMQSSSDLLQNYNS